MIVLGVTDSHQATELVEADAIINSLAALRLTVIQEGTRIEVFVSSERAF